MALNYNQEIMRNIIKKVKEQDYDSALMLRQLIVDEGTFIQIYSLPEEEEELASDLEKAYKKSVKNAAEAFEILGLSEFLLKEINK